MAEHSMNEIITAGIIFITAIGAAVAIAAQIFRRSTSLGRIYSTSTESLIEEPVHVEKLSTAPSPVSSTKAVTASKEGLSDEEFKTLFLNADKSIEDIAKTCGYKANSSVYRRAKRLGLAADTRKR